LSIFSDCLLYTEVNLIQVYVIKFVNKLLVCLKSSGKMFMNNLDEDKFNVYINITEQSGGWTTMTTTSNSHCADKNLCRKVCNFNTWYGHWGANWRQWESASKMIIIVLYCIVLYCINIVQLLMKTIFKFMQYVSSISKTIPFENYIFFIS
jgi:hypothetical protein